MSKVKGEHVRGGQKNETKRTKNQCRFCRILKYPEKGEETGKSNMFTAALT